LIAVLGAAGLAVGLALQGSLANFASGVLLLALRPCRAGDYVDAGGCSGTIEKIDILATTMVTPDNKVVVVPNACIMGGPITNYSAKETRRIDLTLGVSYDADLNQVKSIINELLAQDDRILKDPAPTVAVVALADSSINLVVRPWVKKADYWNCYFDLQQGMKEAMDRNNISIPFPQVDVHFDNNAHFDNK
jgi:small conductance mechanosensitive channel